MTDPGPSAPSPAPMARWVPFIVMLGIVAAVLFLAPRAEPPGYAEHVATCRAKYQAARTAADTAQVDQYTVPLAAHLTTRCGELRAKGRL